MENIEVQSGLLGSQRLIDICQPLANQFVIITDDHVETLYARQLKVFLESHQLKTHLIVFPRGEAFKTRETKAVIEDQMLALSCGRDTCVIALGGGVVTDLAGFVASTYCRGVPAVYLPTTLLAMTDAAIGGKTGVNTDHGKNLVGTFSQPKAVLCDVDTLKTLSDFELCTGLVEVIKHAVIADKTFFDELEACWSLIMQRDVIALIEVIRHSIGIKVSVVEQDEKEAGLREILNFGHTIGHAVETLSQYEINHGQAVAIGMQVEGYLSKLHGFLSEVELEKMQGLLAKLEINLRCSEKMCSPEKIKKALVLDKKSRGSKPRFVLLDEIGKAHQHDNQFSMTVADEQLNQALVFFAERFLC